MTQNHILHHVAARTLRQCRTPVISIADTTPLQQSQGKKSNLGWVSSHERSDGKGTPFQERRQPREEFDYIVNLTITNSYGNTSLDRGARLSATCEAVSAKDYLYRGTFTCISYHFISTDTIFFTFASGRTQPHKRVDRGRSRRVWSGGRLP